MWLQTSSTDVETPCSYLAMKEQENTTAMKIKKASHSERLRMIFMKKFKGTFIAHFQLHILILRLDWCNFA